MTVDRWFYLAVIFGLLLAIGACMPTRQGQVSPTPVSLFTPTPSSPQITSPMPDSLGIPAEIAAIKIEQTEEKFAVAFYLVDQSYQDTISNGVARFHVNSYERSNLTGRCLPIRGIADYSCELYESEELVSASDFQLETWEEMDCAEAQTPEGDLIVKIPGCIGQHDTCRFEQLAVDREPQSGITAVDLSVEFEVEGQKLEGEKGFSLRHRRFQPILKAFE
jgi:hypothetical protein